MCVSVNQCLRICTYLHLNVSVCCIKWVFDHGPQSDRSQVLQIVWCMKNGKVMFKYIRKSSETTSKYTTVVMIMSTVNCPKIVFALLKS